MGFLNVFEKERNDREVYGIAKTSSGSKMQIIEFLEPRLKNLKDRLSLSTLKTKYNLVSMEDKSAVDTRSTVFFGMSADPNLINGGSLGSLNSTLKHQGTLQLPIQGLGEYIYFGTTQDFGTLLQIRDGNNFIVYQDGGSNNSFEKYSATVVVDGISKPYFIYRTLAVTSVPILQNFTLTY